MEPKPAQASSRDPRAARADRSVDRRERKRTRTKLMLQTEALKLFDRQGYETTTIEDIADAAAVSPRTFFRYFPTKEDVVLWDEYGIDAAAEFLHARAKDAPIAELVWAFIREGMVGLQRRDRDRLLARTRLIFTVPALQARVWDQHALTAALASVAPRLGISPNDLRLHVLIWSLTAAAVVAADRWQQDDGSSDLVALFDQAVAALAEGMQQLQPAQRARGPDGSEPTASAAPPAGG
jgi:AcrR family transcriptional regulator